MHTVTTCPTIFFTVFLGSDGVTNFFTKKFTWSKSGQLAQVSLTILLQIKSKKVMAANVSTTCKFVYDALVFCGFLLLAAAQLF